MANQITIDIGAAANDGTGDPLRTAFNYVNNNFSNVWTTGLPNSNVQFSDNRILTVNTNANLVLAPNGIGIVQSNVDIIPSINRGQSLGSTVKKWNSVNTYYVNADSANIGSFGNLTVAVANLHITGGSNGYVLQTDGAGNLTWTAQTGGGGNGIPGGANTQVQYNNAGSFGGSAAFTFNRTSNVLTVNGNISVGNASVTNVVAAQNITATTGTFTGDQFSDGAMYVGTPAGTVLGSDVVIQITANSGSYSQTNFQNINSGVTASSDYILTADNGNNTTHFLDMGITSSGWDGSETNVLSGLNPNNGYLYVQDGNLTLGTRAGNVSYSWKFDTTGNLTVAGNVIPTGNNTQSLGNATRQWNDLWLSNATIYMNSVPISLATGNILTVDGADVVITAANGESSIGNLDILGTVIEIAAGAPETLISISPDVEGWAYLQLPNDATANSANTRLHNDAGNVEIGTGDFSTGITSYTWTFGNDGNVIIPGSILGTATVVIDNRGTGNTSDIQLYSADDILLQARDRTLGDDIEGGDINIYAGDGSPDDAGGGTGSGGDIQIIGGVGGVANVSSGGSGGFVRLDAGNGGDGSATAAAGSGATAYLSAGSGGVDNGGGGNNGGDVVVTAGDTTDVAQDRGSIILNAGGGGNASTLGGYVQVHIPSVGTNPGGDWTFTGSGTTLETPANAEIFGPNFGNLTVGAAGNTIITSADYGITTYNWVFDNAGGIVAPNLTVTRGDRTGTLTGSTLRIGNGSQEAILTTPNGVDGSDSQRLVINPGAGSEFGEGGDIYLYSGRGGASGGSGGDIKIRGGLGPADGYGGYIDIVGGEAAGNGVGGYIDILGGQSANSTGGNVRIYGGQGITGGDANITGGVGTAGPGGAVNIAGGVSSNGLPEYGNVNITSGASTWTFNNTGNLIVPGEGVIRSIDDTIKLQSYETAGNISRGLRVGTNGGLYLEIGNNQPWLSFTVDSGDAEIGAAPGVAGTGNAGYNLTLFGGPADTSVYGTGAGGNIDLRAGLGASNDGGGGGPGGWVNIISGNSYDPAGVAGNVTINSGSNTWTFDNTGMLTLPGGDAAIIPDLSGTTSFQGAANTGVVVTSSGNVGSVTTSWVDRTTDLANARTASMTLNSAGTANAQIQVADLSSNTISNWTFESNGTLTAPGPIQMAVYANATVRDAAITSPAPGMMIYVTGTGMQVRGATSWNTVAGSGT